MREYETVFILQPQIADAQASQINEKIKNTIERYSGRLFFARSLGRKNLSYRIKKQTKGLYYVLDYAAHGECVKDLERSLMLDENVLRFLTVMKDSQVDVEARAAEIEARGEGLPETEEKEAGAAPSTKEVEQPKEE